MISKKQAECILAKALTPKHKGLRILVQKVVRQGRQALTQILGQRIISACLRKRYARAWRILRATPTDLYSFETTQYFERVRSLRRWGFCEKTAIDVSELKKITFKSYKELLTLYPHLKDLFYHGHNIQREFPTEMSSQDAQLVQMQKQAMLEKQRRIAQTDRSNWVKYLYPGKSIDVDQQFSALTAHVTNVSGRKAQRKNAPVDTSSSIKIPQLDEAQIFQQAVKKIECKSRELKQRKELQEKLMKQRFERQKQIQREEFERKVAQQAERRRYIQQTYYFHDGLRRRVGFIGPQNIATQRKSRPVPTGCIRPPPMPISRITKYEQIKEEEDIKSEQSSSFSQE